jgi:signal peptidase I
MNKREGTYCMRPKPNSPPRITIRERLLSIWKEIWWIAGFVYFKFLIFDFRIKIPTGSMEPTLHGHPDYGDNVCVNRFAYASAFYMISVLGGLLLILGSGVALSGIWRRVRLRVSVPVLMIVLSALAWSCRNSVADEPRRFQIATFNHESVWNNPGAPNESVEYVKRVIGLPGERIVISGGDLFRLNPQTQKNEILRKWQVSPQLQESLWMTVAKCWPKIPHLQISDEDRQRIEFPWSGAENGTTGVSRERGCLVFDGSSKVTLNYRYPVTNIFVKQGRWPFSHDNCPAQNGSETTAYISETCEGVQCPLCKRVMFPIALTASDGPLLSAGRIEGGSFLGGGESVVGDLKLDVAIDLARSGGTIQIEIGSTLHRAAWTIPSASTADESDCVHPVKAQTDPLPAGHHTLSLAYVDATVIATLDGREIERRCIDVNSPGKAAERIASIARIGFDGVQGKLTQLDLSRDLFYAAAPTQYLSDPNAGISQRQSTRRYFENGEFVFEIPKDSFLMLGDNSPSSSDGRIWGFVPRKNMTGRATGITWPPSRWQTLR